jgi:CRISPR/Cas system CSM-associated protein Csm2 small subunit
MPMADEDDAPEGEDEAAAAEAEDGGDELSATEATAREQGWTPKEQFRGDPNDWIDADEYVKRGDPRYLRKQLGQTERQLRKLEQQRTADQTAFEQRLTKMETLNKVQRRKMYAEIESTRRAAAAVGDMEEYDRQNEMEQQLYQAEQEAGKATAKEEPETKAVKPHPDVEKWVSENLWFTKNKMLNRAAEGIHEQLMEDEPGLTIAENLAKTRAEVIKRFPEKFSKTPQAKNGHSAVESGARAAQAPKGKGFTDIPGEERKVMEAHIKEGLYKDKADAATAYWSQ